MERRESENQPSNLRELVAYMVTKNWEPGFWRGLIYGIIAGTI